MNKATSLIAIVLVAFSSLAHANVSEGAHAFKTDVKEAGKKTGHAVHETVHAIGDGAKAAGHAIADASKQGYHATKKFVTGHE